MHSVRRAVLRSAASASASVSRTAATTGFATPLIRSVAAQAVRRPANLSIAARYFSQTTRVANTEEPVDADAAPESTPSTDAPAAAADQTETPHAVFVRNIVFDASEAHLQEAFEHYGPVSKAVIARDARGLSRGYGFIWFNSEEAMTKALQEANGSFWHGRRIIVLPRAPRAPLRSSGGAGGSSAGGGARGSSRSPTDSLYIGNLPYETTDADLNLIFRELEGLRAVRVAVDRSTGWPRGFAHADFESVENAEAAYEHLRGKTIGSRTLRIDYASPSKNESNVPGQADSSYPPSESTLRQ